MNKIKVGIIGGTGYTGVELLRLLVTHPSIDVALITSRAEAGREVVDLFPSLRGFTDLCFSPPDTELLTACDLVFSATPNGIAMTHARALTAAGTKLIDLAADFRIRDIATWEKWYGMQHACPELVAQAVYGLPEMNRQEITNAMIVANPGCYPTATTLGLLPLVQAGLIRSNNLIVDAKSGVTGAGRGANVASLFSEVADSFRAYGVAGHRHHPEITQNIQSVSKSTVDLTFVPHLVPMLRGIHATIYADLIDLDKSLEDVHHMVSSFYADEAFVDVMPLGSHPDTRSVKTSNMCRIALHKAGGSGKLVILSVIDNLTKGAAGQAVQNMNIMLGLDETLGLMSPAVMP
ncbi:N-acetyl-gamma-glutamyl-phosphate reductase [Arenicella xantha]|uniref:N-acetyl-gamma-glutamyl-phosphate reductase n=1 Tax=Arenicella xantha TaxID=644221 RepID=A0A395JLW3_9GAMM|nr:N-acetyl-gamma-glutamyl-phosphate reductase [Arenicella xantha]RBP52634.1 N-acetyl-gamma-glutamyl-phosphate reductase [Arenicella xantha]